MLELHYRYRWVIKCLTDLELKYPEELKGLRDIGETVASNIHEFFDKEENKRTLKELEEAGVRICKSEEDQEKEEKLKGLTFVFTGGLDSYTRQEAKDLVQQLGGRAVSSVSSNVDYLVRGENAGSKLEEAESRLSMKKSS